MLDVASIGAASKPVECSSRSSRRARQPVVACLGPVRRGADAVALLLAVAVGFIPVPAGHLAEESQGWRSPLGEAMLDVVLVCWSRHPLVLGLP